MSDFWFSSVSAGAITAASFFWCTLTALVLGALIALGTCYKSRYSSGFLATLALLPVMVEVIIMLVNGQIGTGIAIMGAFSLIRFRSVPGTAKEITGIFLAMVVGLACGGGYLGVAILSTVVVVGMSLLYAALGFGRPRREEKDLRITIPENLDYSGVFDDLWPEYTTAHELARVKSTNMGSLFQLSYRITMRDSAKEKALLDEIRCRNGNLEVSLSKVDWGKDAL